MARHTAAEWRDRVARFDASGLTIDEFSGREKLEARQLRWWKWRFAKQEKPSKAPAPKRAKTPSFLPVVLRTTSAGVPSRPFEIVTRAGITVRVPADFDGTALLRLLTVLEGA